MKKRFKFVCLAGLICSCNLYAQSVNMERMKTDPVIAVEASKMNVLYYGVENPIKIACSGVNSSELQVEVTNGKIAGSDGEYVISPGQSGTLDLRILHKGKLLGIKNFRVLPIPDPIAHIRIISGEGEKHIYSGTATIDQLLTSPGLIAPIKDFLFEVEYKIIGFTLDVEPLDGITKRERSDSDKFTAEQKKILRDLRPGQRVAMEEIQAIGPDGITRDLNLIFLKIE